MILATCGHCETKNRFPPERAQEAVCGKCGTSFAQSFQVTDENFERLVILQERPVLVAILSYTAEYCQEFIEFIERVANAYAGHMGVAFLKSADSPKTNMALDLRYDCTTLIFRNTFELYRLQGVHYGLIEDVVRCTLSFPRLPNQNEFANSTLDVTNKIERLEIFEEKLDVRLESLYARLHPSGFLEVNGELHSSLDVTLPNSIRVVCALYDESNRVLDQSGATISAATFYGFEIFYCNFGHEKTSGFKKIRLFPKLY